MKNSSLSEIVSAMPPLAVAVSGGVDSVTLAALAAQIRPDVKMFHAVSPAVPAEATARVRRTAAERGWDLLVISAGEFEDPLYRANPVDRCFHCKTNLYSAIVAKTDRQVVSGANLDDLGEYRPGLDAARNHRVRHPYIEAAMNKSAVRALARALGLGEVAELPSSPCLSSRVETGIRIESQMLSFIHDIELLLNQKLQPNTVRCRVRADGVVVELDEHTLNQIDPTTLHTLQQDIAKQCDFPGNKPIRFEPYRNGSAFLIRQVAR